MTTPASMTFDSLVKDIEEHAERHDEPFIKQIPRFIMLCENRIASEVRGLGLLQFVGGTLEGAILKKPMRWRETAGIHVTVNNRMQYLKKRGYAYCRKFAPDSSKTGAPRFYADYGYEHWLVVPTPTLPYEVEIAYFERPMPLGSANQTNWTTQNAPQLLLYGSLLEAQLFLKRDERVDVYKSFFGQAQNAVTMESLRRLQDRGYSYEEE